MSWSFRPVSNSAIPSINLVQYFIKEQCTFEDTVQVLLCAPFYTFSSNNHYLESIIIFFFVNYFHLSIILEATALGKVVVIFQISEELVLGVRVEQNLQMLKVLIQNGMAFPDKLNISSSVLSITSWLFIKYIVVHVNAAWIIAILHCLGNTDKQNACIYSVKCN